MTADIIRVDQEACRDLDGACKLEWLETNGLGGFASSTVIGLNTRRYHGLLTAATKPPVGRVALLSKMEETLLVDGRRFDLSANRYPGAVHPQGHRYLREFRLDPFPTFVYEVEGIEIEKRVFMVHGENTTVVEYEIRSTATHVSSCALEVRPLVAFRDYHASTHRNDALNPSVRRENDVATIAPYAGLPELHFGHSPAALEITGEWYFNFEYAREQERGLDAHEDLFNPFLLRFAARDGATATVIASTEVRPAALAMQLRAQEIQRRKRVIESAPSDQPLIQRLTAAAGQFIVQRGTLNSIIAGYHWFADWGRDTMIALPGIALVTGRHDVARNILEAFAQSADQGMLPNRFPDAGESPEYNTVDATLWFFEAVRSYLKYTGDWEFVRKRLYPALKDMVDWHVRGTRYGIHVDEDGLLRCGEPGVQLTWMDAKVGDWVVTPRMGKPVEIQALWYNALRILRELADKFGDVALARSLDERSRRAKESFHQQFWNAQAGCLYDVVDGDHRDSTLRPNQIFAVSLPHGMLPLTKQRQVVEIVERELLTPLGLRSLSPDDPNYRPRYEGGVLERDSAYHQGTVWPWLLGPFISAYVKVHGRGRRARQRAEELLSGFEGHVRTAALGQISEIADADLPHQPRGCVAQAWSVGELLRAVVEDVYELPACRQTESAAVAV